MTLPSLLLPPPPLNCARSSFLLLLLLLLLPLLCCRLAAAPLFRGLLADAEVSRFAGEGAPPFTVEVAEVSRFAGEGAPFSVEVSPIAAAAAFAASRLDEDRL